MAKKELPPPPTSIDAADYLEGLGVDERKQRRIARDIGASDAALLAGNGALLIAVLSWAFAGYR